MPVLSKQNNDIIGIVSERDLARFICKDEFKNDLPVSKIMTKIILFINLPYHNTDTGLRGKITWGKLRFLVGLIVVIRRLFF